MRAGEVLVILLVTFVCCAAVTHGFDFLITKERARIKQASAYYERWRASPAGSCWEKAELDENRLRQALWFLDETPIINHDMAVILSEVQSLGTNLRQFSIVGPWIKVRVTHDPEKALDSLRNIQGTSEWRQDGPDELTGLHGF